MKKKLYILLISIFACSFSALGQKVEKTTLSSDSLLIGDQVVWEAYFSLPDGTPIQIPSYSELLAKDTTIRGGVEVVREFELDSISVKNGIRNLRARLMLTSFDSGSYILPAPIILYSTTGEVDTLKLESKQLYVTTIPIDTASFQMYDIKKQEGYPYTLKEFLPWILAALALAAIVWGIVRYVKMRRQNRGFFGKSIVKEPAHIVALKKLEKLRTGKLWQSGKEKAFYSGITDTLKEYIDERYSFGATEKTSSEIMEELRKRVADENVLANLNAMFTTADLVKFAKHTPTEADNENAVPAAVNFVNYAYMEQLKEEEVK